MTPACHAAVAFLHSRQATRWFHLLPLQNDLDQATKAQLLRQATKLLLSHGVATTKDVLYILHARVPIVKFRDAQHGQCAGTGTASERQAGG